jgi:predicted O-methyltransferase YrrM
LLTLPEGNPPARRGGAARALGFVRPWAFGLASSVFLFAVGWTKWKHRAAIVELCRHFGYAYDTREPVELRAVPASDVAPETGAIDVREMEAVDGNVSERELVILARLVKHVAPRSIFEFGTFDGRTTLNLALNAPPAARVATLDLPASQVTSAAAPIHAHEVRYADKPHSGSRFAGTEAASRIDQLHGDSGVFDFSAYYDSIDLVFVDASHTYEYVINDSLHALRMLRGGSGTIVWHDYSRWDGVTRALNELRRSAPEFSGLAHISGTTLAILRRETA